MAQLQLAIDGEVVMTDEYATVIDELFNAKVPKTWMFTGKKNYTFILIILSYTNNILF